MPLPTPIQPPKPQPRPDPARVIGWENRGGEAQTAWRNVDFINGPPQGYAGSTVETTLLKFAAQGWTRVAVRSPWGTSSDNVIRFEQPLDCLDQGFSWLDESYRALREKIEAAGVTEWIDYIGSPETLVARTSDPLYRRELDAIADRVLTACGSSIGFDNTSGVPVGSFSQRLFEQCDLWGVKVYVEAIPSQACPHLWHRPFFTQESFDETVEGQQASGTQAAWAATRAELTGERMCILDQPPPGADWNNLGSDAWRAGCNAILGRGDTLAVDPAVIMALWPL